MALRISSTSDNLSADVARFVAAQSAQAIQDRGKFVVALSGGSMPKLLALMVDSVSEGDWPHWHVFFADERCVATDHDDSNFKACAPLLGKVPRAQVHSLPGLPEDLSSLAPAYESELRAACDGPADAAPVLDLILLGVGPDGHTASLFPGHPLLGSAPPTAVRSTLLVPPSVAPPPSRAKVVIASPLRCRWRSSATAPSRPRRG